MRCHHVIGNLLLYMTLAQHRRCRLRSPPERPALHRAEQPTGIDRARADECCRGTGTDPSRTIEYAF